ncbi:MAG TPA: glutamyl-tRNA reductase, partial [Blastocatellia bacterium]|nr:glutamyl-tRNA reductase [Blastocatellia bacterium]
MNIVLIGINHRTAPVEMRERLAFGESHIPDALSAMVEGTALDEGLIVSTCNRVELLASATHDPEKGIHHLTKFLCEFHQLPASSIDQILYRHSDGDAIKHVFRVASSLDSMVVGEPQILGQVKEAYQHAVQAGTIGRVLSQLMDRAISVARRIRNETGISHNPVSVSSVAVELARKIFGELDGKTVLLVGAGEMAELAARYFVDAGASHLIVTNRTAARAEAIAHQFGGGAVNFEAFYDVLPNADVVICSTGAPEYVLKHAEVGRALRLRKKGPIVFIDISVPRNIDPAVAGQTNCFLFDIDDLKSVVDSNLKEREIQAQAAELIVDSEVEQFLGSLRTLDIGPSILELKSVLSDLALSELRRNRKRLGALTPEQEAVIKDVIVPGLVNKLSHPIIVHMRTAMRNGECPAVLEELR